MDRSMSCPSVHLPGQLMRAAAASTNASQSSWRSPGTNMNNSNRSARYKRAAGVRRSWAGEEDVLPPLTKGALRHRTPACASSQSQTKITVGQSRHLLDLDAAEAFGLKLLREDSWVHRLFEEADGPSSGYLWPSEFAALGSRFEEAMEGFHGRFRWSFAVADANLEGRVSWPEWQKYAATLVEVFGETRCRVAAQRVLGARKAEARKKVKNLFIFDGFEAEPSLRLIEICSKGYKNSSLVEHVRNALAAKADPNAGLASPSFNNYTPLIFLAMTPPGTNGAQIAAAMDVLVAAGADVHRECGQMETGRLVPMRFAARLQNQDGLRSLSRYVDVGDMFHWAAGENMCGLMLTELESRYGKEVAARIERLSPFSNHASVQMRLFASPLVPGTLSADGAQKLCAGKFDDGFIRAGEKADPNSPGLQGRTALMQMVMDGRVEVIESMLAGRASPHQRDSGGATPLHYAAAEAQPDAARALLNAGAELHALDHAGFSPWMVVGEGICFHVSDDGRTLPCAERVTAAAGPAVNELLDLLEPRFTPEELLAIAEENVEGLLDLFDGNEISLEAMEQLFRLQESLFFSPRMAIKGAFQGRTLRQHLLLRLATIMIEILRIDPLEGNMKLLAKYFLNATKGPNCHAACGHVHVPWEVEDNRAAYRAPLMEAVKTQLGYYASACGQLRQSIDKAARDADSEDADEASLACAALLSLPNDVVDVPESWQKEDPHWEAVQQRQVLRYDPVWSREISDGASCCMQLLRLGVPADEVLALKIKQKKDFCAVTSIPEYSSLRQVLHAPMQELYGRGYVTYSNLCNKLFQDKMKEVAERARDAGADVGMPEKLVGAKRLPRIMEKTRDALKERAGWEWPGRPDFLNRNGYCFYILDTVRMGFSCRGATVPEQVQCSMQLLGEFEKCTVEADGVCLLRKKSGFASGVSGDGGYADVKMLLYADLGEHIAFDGTKIPLQIVGEVQLILESYEHVKHRMHLVYEVNRGSFDRKA